MDVDDGVRGLQAPAENHSNSPQLRYCTDQLAVQLAAVRQLQELQNVDADSCSEEVREAVGENVLPAPPAASRPSAGTPTSTLDQVLVRAVNVLMSPRGSREDASRLLSRCTRLESVLTELSTQAEHALADLRRQNADLQLQLGSAGKQLRVERAFRDELAGEHESERDECSRERRQLQVQLVALQRDKDELLARRRDLDGVEAHNQQLSAVLYQAQMDRSNLQQELKAAVVKIRDLRDVIRTLELRLDQMSLAAEQAPRLSKLTADLKHQLYVTKQLEQMLQSCRCARTRDKGAGGDTLFEEYPAGRTGRQNVSLDSEFSIVSACPSLLTEFKQQILELGCLVDNSLDEAKDNVSNQSSVPNSDSGLSAETSVSLVGNGAADTSSQQGDISAELQQLRCKVDRLAAVKGAALKQVAALQSLQVKLHSSVQDMASERDAMQTQLGERLVELSSLRAQLQQHRLAVDMGTELNAQRQDRLAFVQTELQRAQQSVAGKNQQVADLHCRLEEVQSKLVVRESELSRLRSQQQLFTPVATAPSPSTAAELQQLRDKYTKLQTRHHDVLNRLKLEAVRRRAAAAAGEINTSIFGNVTGSPGTPSAVTQGVSPILAGGGLVPPIDVAADSVDSPAEVLRLSSVRRDHLSAISQPSFNIPTLASKSSPTSSPSVDPKMNTDEQLQAFQVHEAPYQRTLEVIHPADARTDAASPVLKVGEDIDISRFQIDMPSPNISVQHIATTNDRVGTLERVQRLRVRNQLVGFLLEWLKVEYKSSEGTSTRREGDQLVESRGDEPAEFNVLTDKLQTLEGKLLQLEEPVHDSEQQGVVDVSRRRQELIKTLSKLESLRLELCGLLRSSNVCDSSTPWQRLQADGEHLRTRCAELDSGIKELRSHNQTLQTQCHTRYTVVQQLQNRNRSLMDECEANGETIKRLQNENDALESQCQRIISRQDYTEAENQRFQQLNSAVELDRQQQVEALRTRLRRQAAVVKQLTVQLSASRPMVATADRAVQVEWSSDAASRTDSAADRDGSMISWTSQDVTLTEPVGLLGRIYLLINRLHADGLQVLRLSELRRVVSISLSDDASLSTTADREDAAVGSLSSAAASPCEVDSLRRAVQTLSDDLRQLRHDSQHGRELLEESLAEERRLVASLQAALRAEHSSRLFQLQRLCQVQSLQQQQLHQPDAGSTDTASELGLDSGERWGDLRRRQQQELVEAAGHGELTGMWRAIGQLSTLHHSPCTVSSSSGGGERQLLERRLAQLEVELTRTERQEPSAAQLLTYGKYLRSESYRRALCWQKRYLMILLRKQLPAEEDQVDLRLGMLQLAWPPLSPRRRFRVAAHVIVALHRMKYLVRRWRCPKRR